MVDPTSDINENVDEEDAPRCAVCENPVIGSGHRVITRIEDGEVATTHFCSPECRSEWGGEG